MLIILGMMYKNEALVILMLRFYLVVNTRKLYNLICFQFGHLLEVISISNRCLDCNYCNIIPQF